MKLRMIGSSAVIAALLVGLVVSVTWAASAPIDDPYFTSNAQWNGTSMLLDLGFKAVQSNLQGALTSTTQPSALFILGPTRPFTVSEAATISGYVANGGILILSDNFGSGNSLLQLMGLPIRFDGRHLVDTLFYTKQPDFPTIFDLPRSDLSSGINALTLNYPTSLNITNTHSVTIVAFSTPFSFLDTNQNGVQDIGEPTGPFPVLAEIMVGQGRVIAFTSPGSFTNGMLNVTDNEILLDNILKLAPIGNVMLDETHLTPSPFTPTKEAAKDMVLSVLQGGMTGSIKIVLMALTICIIAVRYGYRKPEKKETLREGGIVQPGAHDVDLILQLHPTWNRERLEYIKRELDVTRKWRQMRVEED
jgi:hypothetical protein